MRKEKNILIYPLIKGMDTESIPGAQDKMSMRVMENIMTNNLGGLIKRPGVERISYTGKEDGNLRGAAQFFVTSGGSQTSEIVRVIGGRVEALREENIVDLGLSVNDTDTVSFTRFANVLVIHFENTRPKKYTPAGTLSNLGINTSHVSSPPTFSSVFRRRLVYGGMGDLPHRGIFSAVDDLDDYSLASGGFPMSIYEGDGDPVGLTGFSPTFRGDLYAFKLNSIYRIFGNYEIDVVTTELGCVHHNTIVAGANELYFVSTEGIHKMSMVEARGSVKESFLTYPIYKSFQAGVNYSMLKYMIMTYDKQTNSLLLSYASSGSSVNDRVTGLNVKSGEIMGDWKVEWPVLGKYFDVKRQRTLVGDQSKGLGILSIDQLTDFGDPIPVKVKSGLIYPYDDPSVEVVFTKLFLFFRPTDRSTVVTVTWYVDGDLVGSQEVNLLSEVTETRGVDDATFGTSTFGSGILGEAKGDLKTIEIEVQGEGHAIEVEVEATPTASDPEKNFELFGYKVLFDDREDEEQASIN